ncbi:MAG TPA: OmpA family protein [Acetobacteraceae bacterium]|nr:OmpA family protein [Acetobacteraceae bacterium]
MRFRSTLLAATVLAIPFAAQAQPVTGLYIGVGAGVNLKTDQNIKNLQRTDTLTGGISTPNLSVGSRAGFIGLGSIGWGFGNGLRVELEGDYRNNSFNRLNKQPTGVTAAAGGREQLYGPMVNVLYDLSGIIPVPYVAPYFGVGVGYQWAKLQDARVYGTNLGVGSITSDDKRGAFAYQAIVGAAIPIPPVPGLALTAEYRFMGLAGTRDYDAAGTISAPNVRVTSTGKFQLGHEYNNAFLIGLRYNFGVAPPPPPPAPVAAPAPAPARSYLVFFDWDKATLTDRARQIIREAAENSTHVQYTQLEVNGYTDTSGTPQYNMGLSIRRANAVAAELVRDGVPRNAIAIHGFGETHLLVPTGPGVREPQNRRVEIIIR